MQASPAWLLCADDPPVSHAPRISVLSAPTRALGDTTEWLGPASEGILALTGLSIAAALIWLGRKRHARGLSGPPWLLIAFTLAFGVLHLLDATTSWTPPGQVRVITRLVTAVLAIAAAARLWSLLPAATGAAGPSQLEQLNRDLRAEIVERKRAEQRLEAARGELAVRIHERTEELAELNRKLAAGLAEKEVAEESLRESRQRLARRLAEIESLYVSAPVGLCFVDAEARLVRANRMLEEIAGVSLKGNEDRPLAQVLNGAGPALEAECRRVLESGEGAVERLLRVEVGPSRRDRRWLVSSSPVRTEDGAVLGINLLVQDVTERLLIEERLRQSQKTEAVGQLAAGVAHEINNSLTAIYGYLSLARAQLHRPDNGAGEHLDRVMQAAEQAGHITKALLTFSRSDPAHREAIELRRVVEQAMTLFAGLAPASIQVETQTADAEGLLVRGDATQLQQVVLNLAINARDAMPGGGLLRVTVEPGAGLGGEDGLGTARLTIRDTGVGMTREVRERLFEPFFTTKARGHGTGLGTSVVHGIVTSHGGEIRVESAPGRGTTFTIEFPRCRASEGGLDLESAAPSGERLTGTVVLAEDNRAIRVLLARAVREAGFSVLEAQDGQELLDQVAALELAGSPIAALIVDVDMPIHSGLDCLRRIRERGHSAPAVIITGGPGGDAEAGPLTRVLRKPFHARELVDLLRETVAGGLGVKVRG